MDSQSINQEGERPAEPENVLRHLRCGGVGFGDAERRSAIYIPIRVYEVLGEERILQIANEVYSEQHLKEFGFTYALCQNSFFLQLPPQIDYLRKFLAIIRKTYRSDQ